jgi:stage II sporulation protein E
MDNAKLRVDRAKNAALVRVQNDSAACARAAERLGDCARLFTSLADNLGGEERPVAYTASAARQMEAMAGTLAGLREELSEGELLDVDATQMLRETLDRSGFQAARADIVTARDGVEARVTFAVCNGRGDCVREVRRIVNQCTGKRMRARCACEPSSGACTLVYEEVPVFDAITGVACRAAEAPCGDSHAFRALPGGRFMMAIADGMGSGEKAALESDEALTLLEKCLRARLDPAVALPMINDMLLLKGGEEMYTTLDLCMIDTREGVADFYKIGAANSYIRRGGDVMTILSGALPMGILGGVKPTHHRMQLLEGDVVVMVSDGVSDASREEDWMRNQLRRIDTRNPQATADLLETAARFEAGEAADDRTVLCARIFRHG